MSRLSDLSIDPAVLSLEQTLGVDDVRTLDASRAISAHRSALAAERQAEALERIATVLEAREQRESGAQS